MLTTQTAVTRGSGLMERWLAHQRAVRANRLIPQSLRVGRLLDIGCGSYPYFLAYTDFCEKFGVDKLVTPRPRNGDDHEGMIVQHTPTGSATLAHFDIGASDRLPFEDGAFNVVTMLAVFEHIERDRLGVLLNEAARVLRRGGLFVMTTPTSAAGPVLGVMKRLKLVSAAEVDEHVHHYHRREVRAALQSSALRGGVMRFGYFQCGMNQWATVAR